MYTSKAIVALMALAAIITLPSVAEENFRARANVSELSTVTVGDLEAEVRFGRDVAARILGRFKVLDNLEMNHYVNLVGKTLALHSQRSELNYFFAIVDSEQVNAYSTPGGYVFVTTGALKQMRSEAELAAVLAHEIAHISQKHIVHELKISGNQQDVTTDLSKLIGSIGDTANVALSQALDKAEAILFKKGFKQEDELEADQVATMLLAATGYDPTALQRYLDRVEQKTDKAVRGSTHPSTAERKQAMARLIKGEQLAELRFPVLKERFQQYVSP